MRFPVRGYSYEELAEKVTPPASRGVTESFHTQYYDTQTYPLLGTAAPINFFQATNQDLSLSNMQAAGSFPAPQYFQLFAVAFDVILPPSAAAIPQAWQDLWRIRIGSRAYLRLTISDKEYGKIPLRAVHPSGGIEGEGYSAAALAATSSEFAQGGPQSGGFWQDGQVWFPPNTNFNVSLNFSGTLQPVLADTLIRVVLDGVIHRRVL